jgi:anthranilate synthase component 1
MSISTILTKDQFKSGTMVPIVRELPGDFETPATVYMKLANQKPSFLLESITGGEQLARYSFIGVDIEEAFILNESKIEHYSPGEDKVYQVAKGTEPFDVLRKYIKQYEFVKPHGLPRFSGGLAGYIGYNTVNYYEPTVGIKRKGSVPEAIFLVADDLIAFDHAYGRILLIANAKIEEHGESAVERANARLDDLENRLKQPFKSPMTNNQKQNAESFKSNIDQETFEEAVRKAKEYISAGDIFQAVLSQRLSRKTDADPFDIYRSLRRLNPSPYMFFFNFGCIGSNEPFHVIGASPEMHVRLEDGVSVLRPLAGTRKRGQTPGEDLALEQDLLADPKEQAEHIMLVDLGRNDLGRVCKYGSVRVGELMAVERYSHVMHIVSQVEGDLKNNLDSFDLIAATFPAGTVSGAPKIRAMQIIEELEPDARGPYAGAIGYFSYDGSMDSCITIRTLTMHGKQISVQAGAGIVADSEPRKEYEETMNKARALAEAVVLAEGGKKR